MYRILSDHIMSYCIYIVLYLLVHDTGKRSSFASPCPSVAAKYAENPLWSCVWWRLLTPWWFDYSHVRFLSRFTPLNNWWPPLSPVRMEAELQTNVTLNITPRVDSANQGATKQSDYLDELSAGVLNWDQRGFRRQVVGTAESFCTWFKSPQR